MLVCQWHLDIPYGKQAEALAVVRAGGAEKFASSEFRRARGARLLCGLLGPSAPQFRRHSDALASLVVPGSQHWIVYRVLEAPVG
jgi:hypothetical protein